MTPGDGRKGRRLSREDTELWDGVTRSVKPLRKRAPVAQPSSPLPAKAVAKKTGKPAVLPEPLPAVPAKAPPAMATLERRLKQKIARGSEAIDGRLDLHGHTQAEAHDALLRFLHRTQARGGRVVLVITGKGSRSSDGRAAGGVLKRAVPLWLALPEFRALVVGFGAAAIAHGGEGALYVRLRKSRSASS